MVYNSELPAVIIGAGPYGLSIAAYLRGLRVPFRIFGEPMQSWRENMPRGMLLKSEGFASSLFDPESACTLGRYSADFGLPYQDVGLPVPIETFIAYGEEFQRRLVPELERQRITHVAKRGEGFELVTSSRETLSARVVIVATGISHFGYMPPELADRPRELVSHSSEHSRLDEFRGKTVAVLGAGSSASDLAALLHEAGASVHLIARRQVLNFHEPSVEPRPLLDRLLAPRSGLGIGWRSRLCTDAPLLFHMMPQTFRLKVVKRHLGPAPGWFMKDRVEGRFPLHLGTRIAAVEVSAGTLRLDLERSGGGRTLLGVSHLIAATGYRPDIKRLPFLSQELRQGIQTVDDAPVLNRTFECSVPGLYWVGLASANSFGPLTRFAYGAEFTARRLTRHLAATLRCATEAREPSPSSSGALQ